MGLIIALLAVAALSAPIIIMYQGLTMSEDFPDFDELYPDYDDEYDDNEWDDDDYEEDQFLTDAEADADVLRSAGWGTDEDYWYNEGDDDWW